MNADLPALWPHQRQGVDGVLAAIRGGHRRIVLASPTGGGKSRCCAELARHFLNAFAGVSFYTHRKMLLEQASRVMSGYGLDFGIRAAGHKEEHHKRFQLSSIQTENSRAMKAPEHKAIDLHLATLAIGDEGHLLTGESAQAIFRKHLELGAEAVVLVTATPVDMDTYADVIVQAGVNSELRACGALVPAYHYGPDEPDLKGIRFAVGEDLTEGENKKAIMRSGIFGRVIESYRKLNPDNRPSILFAPGVAESIWFAEEFEKAGIPAAHIDGENVWIRGELITSSRSARQEVLDGSRDGIIRVVCNRFVLREGIDAPWLAHGIFATVFGSLKSYLQSGGRLLRSSPSLESVTIQDHGGNWWRHGSLNADRRWQLTDTSQRLAADREQAIRDKKCDPGRSCPKCSKITVGSRWCAACGFDLNSTKVTRKVVESDGTLRLMEGDILPPIKVDTRPQAEKDWISTYFRCLKTPGKTFTNAIGLYKLEHYGMAPPPESKYMPRNPGDLYRVISEVPRENLL